MAPVFDLNRLVATLNNSKTQVTNNPLYQTVLSLINAIRQIQEYLQGQLDAINSILFGKNGKSTGLVNQTYLTATDQKTTLPQSKELLAGTGITFDDTIANKRTINAESNTDYVVLSDGGATPLPINDGAGNFIYVPYSVE